MDPLVEMHLLLREHGWEPQEEDWFEPTWSWAHAGCDGFIVTGRDGDQARWMEVRHRKGPQYIDDEVLRPESTSIDELRRRLEELAQK